MIPTVILLSFIPNIWQFMLLLGTLFFVIFFTPIFQSIILKMDSFVIYPFVCPKCCSFWLSMVLNIFYAYLFTPWFLLWGLITSVALAVMHIYSEKHL